MSAHHQHKNIPSGIEVLLKKAKADGQFRRLFLVDPVGAAESILLALTLSEQAVLTHTPRTTLETMIDSTSVPARFVPLIRASRTAAALTAIVAMTVGSIAAPANPTAEGDLAGPLDYSNPTEGATEQMYVIQEALDWYYQDHDTYPTTEEWLRNDNPLEDYAERIWLFDPWYNKLHYEGVVENGVVVNYRLESLGAGVDSPDDNIPCPVEPELHSFPILAPGEEAGASGEEAGVSAAEAAANAAPPESE
jgi:hypothetical protein